MLVAHGFESVLLVFAHQDATTTNGGKFLFEDVGALALLLPASHSFSCVSDCNLLQGKWMGSEEAVVVECALVVRMELDVDFAHGLASLVVEGAYVVAVRAGPPPWLGDGVVGKGRVVRHEWMMADSAS